MFIDTHSHIGHDLFHPIEGTIEKYLEIQKNYNISHSFIMPCPCPIDEISKIAPVVWKMQNGKLNYSQMDTKNKAIIGESIPNSYMKINDYYKNLLNPFSNISFVPLVHPLLDSLEYINNLLICGVKIVKIHGVAAGVLPENINPEFFKLLSSYKASIIIHTDFDVKNNSPISILRNSNSPYAWIKLLTKFGIKGYLTHGARLDETSLSLVNDNDLFLIGISPDLLLNEEKNRLLMNGDYLNKLLNITKIEKLAFDVDYPWNIDSRNNFKLDFNLITRLSKLMGNEIYTLKKNTEEFFNI